ncbi:MAG: hypothetical protein WEA79_09325 [Balneolaceae bacterium]
MKRLLHEKARSFASMLRKTLVKMDAIYNLTIPQRVFLKVPLKNLSWELLSGGNEASAPRKSKILRKYAQEDFGENGCNI